MAAGSIGLRIPPAPVAPTILTDALNDGFVNTPYSMQLQAIGGAVPYDYSAITLPSGLICSSTGLLSGTPTAESTGSATFTVTGSDAASSQKVIPWAILPDPFIDPTPPGLLTTADFTYLGAFRVPRTNGEPASQSFSFTPVAAPCLSTEGTLYMAGQGYNSSGITIQNVAEISIPTPVISGTVAGLPMATRIQQFADITAGLSITSLGPGAVPQQGVRIGGMIDLGDGRILVNLFIQYDGGSNAITSFCLCSKNLSSPSATGIFALSPDTDTGHSAGHIWKIPASVQGAFGKTHMACLANNASIEARLCFGPGAIGFNAADIGASPASRTVFADYRHGEGFPGTAWGWYLADGRGQNENFNQATNGVGAFHAIRSTKQGMVTIGTLGTGKNWYGTRTEDFSDGHWDHGNPADTAFVQALGLCYDPYVATKGNHAEDYECGVWFTNPADLLAAAGNPALAQNVTPYSIGTLTLPFFFKGTHSISGACYDEATGKVYIVAGRGDGFYPLVHVFQLVT